MTCELNFNQLEKEMLKRMNDKLTVIGSVVKSAAIVNIGERSDSGQLKNNIDYKVDIKNKNVRIYANTVYAAIQELGGEVKARNVKFLTIPISPLAKNKSAKDFKGLFIYKADGKVFLAQNIAGKITCLFVLKKSVQIPERPYLRPALYNNQDNIMAVLSVE